MITVSIIIPLYNKAAYILDTIDSVINQTFSNWEMLVVDNGSTDGSREKVEQIQDSRICILQSPKQGPGAARNYGLTHAQGEWIQFLDADDLLEPDHLEQQLSVAQQNSEAEIIACCWQEFTDNNPAVRTLKYPTGIGQTNQVLRDSAIAFAPWAVHAALIRRSALTPDCYWSEELDRYLGEDIAFWFRLVSKHTVAYGKSQGALYRTQTAQCRTQNLNPQKWFEGIHAAIEFNNKYLQNTNKSHTPNQCENLMRVYSQIYFLANQQKSTNVEFFALSQANFWLNKYLNIEKKPKISIFIRRLLGLKNFIILARNFG